MNDEPVSLAKARADKTNDCREWTPLDALKDLVADIEAGRAKPTQLVVHFMEEAEAGRRIYRYSAAGITYPEHVCLLAVAQARIIGDWQT